MRPGPVGRSFGHSPLNRYRASHRIDCAGELNQYAVARGLDDATTMRGNGRVDDLAAACFQRSQRTDLVGAHQTRVACDIRCQYCRQAPFHALAPGSTRLVELIIKP